MVAAKPSPIEDVALAWTTTGTTNSQGKKGWYNKETGETRYQETQPGTRRPGQQQPAGTGRQSRQEESGRPRQQQVQTPPATSRSQEPPRQPGRQEPPRQPGRQQARPKEEESPLDRLAPADRQRFESLQQEAEREAADPNNAINRLKGQMADWTSSSGVSIQTIRSTQGRPLSAQDHEQVAAFHARIGGMMRALGNKDMAQANFEASQQHRRSAEAKKRRGGQLPAHRPPQSIVASTPESDPLSGTYAYDNQKQEIARSIFGREMSLEDIASISNATDGSLVRVAKESIFGPDSLVVLTEDEKNGVGAARTFRRAKNGDLICYNDNFTIEGDSPYKGKGIELFVNQIQALRKMGVQEVWCHAAGDAGSDYNGYYTWPRFGYDATMDDEQFDSLSEELKRQLGESRSVFDLFSLPGGKEEWKEKGSDLYDAVFDLREGSKSLQRLQNYLEERRNR